MMYTTHIWEGIRASGKVFIRIAPRAAAKLFNRGAGFVTPEAVPPITPAGPQGLHDGLILGNNLLVFSLGRDGNWN